MRDESNAPPTVNQGGSGTSASPDAVVRVTSVGSRGRPDFVEQADWNDFVAWLELSPRQQEVIVGLLEGHRECEIAATLGLSVHTVHTYLNRLYQRFDTHSHGGVIARVFRAFLAWQRLRV